MTFHDTGLIIGTLQEWQERLFLEQTTDVSLSLSAAQLGLVPCVHSQSLLQSDAEERRAVSTGAPPQPRPRSGRCNLSRLLLTDVMLWSGWHAGVSSKTPEQFMGGTEDRFGVSNSVNDEYNIYNI